MKKFVYKTNRERTETKILVYKIKIKTEMKSFVYKISINKRRALFTKPT